MALREGQRVAYTGRDTADLSLGDEGKVFLLEPHCAHVQWDKGTTVPVREYDVAPLTGQTVTAELDETFGMGGLVSFAVRDTYEEGGPVALLNAMSSSGHLGGFGVIAEEALANVMHSIRLDPSVRAVTAQLDEEEGEQFVRLAGICLIRDAFGEGEV